MVVEQVGIMGFPKAISSHIGDAFIAITSPAYSGKGFPVDGMESECVGSLEVSHGCSQLPALLQLRNPKA